MRKRTFTAGIALAGALISANSIAQIQTFELENGEEFGPYAGQIDSPFNGIGAYANDDGVDAQAQLSGIPGRFQLSVTGASSAANTASIAVYLADRKLGSVSFNGTTASDQSLAFDLNSEPSNYTLKFKLETDDGSNDTFLDKFTLSRAGDVPPPPDAPMLPSAGSYYTGEYRNMFAELGYSQAEVTAKVNQAYNQLFHSSNTDLESGEAMFIEADSDSAYIWDTGNDDVRSEGLSYGMMIALQMDRQDDFNKLWKWAYENTLNTSGDFKGYFGWRHKTNGEKIDPAPAPDGEEYFVTALFFAAHRWGNGTGIYNYTQQANQILDDMFGNGQTRYNNEGELEEFTLFNHVEKQIVFSPATPTDRNWTDPSYHLPGFYELWARWATNNKQFWADAATTSREFFKKTVHPTTGLNPDYAYFDGRPYADFGPQHQHFEFDAWRTAANIGLDFSWFMADPWATTFSKRLHNFFESEGVSTHGNRFELDGTERGSDHSPGLVAMNAVAALASDDANAFKFVQELWDAPIPAGRYRYYDGCLYLFGLLAMSGQYRIYCPAGECDPADGGDTGGGDTGGGDTGGGDTGGGDTGGGDTGGGDTGGGDTDGGDSSDLIAVPGRIEAESYVRESGTQTENTSDSGGGLNVGYIQNGDNTEYAINVNSAGRYQVDARIASATAGGTLDLLINDQQVGSIDVSGTGGWQNWQTLSTDIDLNEGSQTLKLNYRGGNGYLFNVNWLDIAASQSGGGDSSGGDGSNAGVSCEFIVNNDWNTGFSGNIKVTNNGANPITQDWSVSWSYGDGSTFNNGWNANFSGSNPYTATPLPWNKVLNPGQTVEFGVQNTKGAVGVPAPNVLVTGPICD